ncbi:N-acetylmuramidase family protein [Achromobacter insolitus]|uniref:N-acetylmuramidase family protein n=1 Tax=Achromobacter insolitus TaxID=217204 RepID=UPI0028A7A595|nr:N-acetylmuramidase family protein [Achromobacter insolitus]
MAEVLRKGARGQAVADLQQRLVKAGYAVARSHVFDDETYAAVVAFQRRARLVDDGVYGAKTAAALAGGDLSRLLTTADLKRAADTLGVPLATVRAVNEVEAQGPGFLSDGRPVILFERHVFHRRLVERGIDPAPLMARYPGIVNKARGGYAGGAAEYQRFAIAAEIHRDAAIEACSWGAFQVMGYHWEALGYESAADWERRMRLHESEHLDAFVRFILADPALHKALIGRKWATFARGYNGPAYAENLYDVKLARAFERFAAVAQEAA